jgi:hypothetical protein
VPKGWTIEIAIEDHRCNRAVHLQSFDVAIEGQTAAEQVVRQRAGESSVICSSQERSQLPGLSPGRVRSRTSILVPRSRLAPSA